ncbi:hypothetical protein LS66_005415 [Helicobacter sp. MIT 03-1614]|uniref:hypothetical protein n=1 Tax=Helicobacter sp. MIT 03-1614 TaxID=1548147 RepID=UPI0005136A6D|nr:hypothetical protein [Helicobacter sp. MIT 03-1614]TLD88965.1 hypothetical protein LS66_005415 [Helicobacter sp. MIT 03-1614]
MNLKHCKTSNIYLKSIFATFIVFFTLSIMYGNETTWKKFPNCKVYFEKYEPERLSHWEENSNHLEDMEPCGFPLETIIETSDIIQAYNKYLYFSYEPPTHNEPHKSRIDKSILQSNLPSKNTKYNPTDSLTDVDYIINKDTIQINIEEECVSSTIIFKRINNNIHIVETSSNC